MMSTTSERHQKNQANQHTPKGATDSPCSRRVDHLIRLDVVRSVLDCDDSVTYLDREFPSALPTTSDGLPLPSPQLEMGLRRDHSLLVSSNTNPQIDRPM
jgi:hypothetical protein